MNNLTSKSEINTILIKDVEGFTFTTEDNTMGFGFIDLNLNLERIITVVEIDEYNNKTFFSMLITKIVIGHRTILLSIGLNIF